MRVRYEMDFEGTNALMRSDDMQRVLHNAARRGEQVARATGGGGEYRIDTAEQGHGHWRDRAEARLVAVDAPYVEDGPSPLSTAVDAIENP